MKLFVNDKEEKPSKKVKLYREIESIRAKLIVEKKEELDKFKAELESKKNK
jgi:hypothetical protein